MMPLIDRNENRPFRGVRARLWPKAALLLVVPYGVWSCAAVEKLTNEWSLNIRTSSDTCPAIAQDGTIYFGTFTGSLWAVRSNGSRKWVFRAGLEIKSSP